MYNVYQGWVFTTTLVLDHSNNLMNEYSLNILF